MRAILEACNGLLFGSMDIAELESRIFIPCPSKLRFYNYTEMQYGPIPQPMYVMVFEYKRRLDENTVIYEFTEIENRGITQ